MATYTGRDTETGRFFYTPRRDEAKDRDPDFAEIDLPKTQKDLLPFLEELANRQSAAPEPEAEPPCVPSPEPVAADPTPILFEDQFEQMPLSTQLHYASLAVEHARTQIKEKP